MGFPIHCFRSIGAEAADYFYAIGEIQPATRLITLKKTENH